MENLEKIAQTDPKYLWWIWSKAGPNLSDEAYYAVVDIMEKYEIPFDKSENEFEHKEEQK